MAGKHLSLLVHFIWSTAGAAEGSQWQARGAQPLVTEAKTSTAPRRGARNRREAPMPATYCSLHYHVVFSTKDRYPTITKDWCDNLHAYLGGIVKNLGGVPLAIGGIEDHARVLMGLCAIQNYGGGYT